MNLRCSFPSSTLAKGAAVLLSLPWIVIVGCDPGSRTTDKAVVLVQEPSAVSGGKTAIAAPSVTSAPVAAETPAKVAETSKTENAPVAAAEGWGTIKGRVVFEGTVPAVKILVPKGGEKDTKDVAICAKAEIDSERLVVNATNKGVRNVLVYIPKPTQVNPEAASAAKVAPVEFDQKNCRFVPHVLAAMKGATVTIKSSDAVGHNTNSSLNNNKFNLPTQPNSSMPWLLRQADKPGRIVCDIHNWMEAYWLILDNPYFAVTDADGNFEIKNAPAGDQKVVVWAEALGPGYLTSPSGDTVSVKAGGDTAKEFKLDASKLK